MYKTEKNLRLLLPIALLVLLVVVVVTLLSAGYVIEEFLLFAFILIGMFLIYQITRQLMGELRVKHAITKMDEAEKFADSGSPMEAVKIWKSLLISLPKENYLQVLLRLEETYDDQDMSKAVQQVKAIHAKSVKFFDIAQNIDRITRNVRRDWQTRAFELRKMISALPVQKDQDFSDVKPEE